MSAATDTKMAPEKEAKANEPQGGEEKGRKSRAVPISPPLSDEQETGKLTVNTSNLKSELASLQLNSPGHVPHKTTGAMYGTSPVPIPMKYAPHVPPMYSASTMYPPPWPMMAHHHAAAERLSSSAPYPVHHPHAAHFMYSGTRRGSSGYTARKSPLPAAEDKSPIPSMSNSTAAATSGGSSTGGKSYTCETCGKVYKHPNCLSKHKWEHTEYWKDVSKFALSKHQQVQMLQAASILIHIRNETSPSLAPSDSPKHPQQQQHRNGSLAGESDSLDEDDSSAS